MEIYDVNTERKWVRATWKLSGLSVQYACKSEITLKLKGLFNKIINKPEWSSRNFDQNPEAQTCIQWQSCTDFEANPRTESLPKLHFWKSISYCHFFYFLHSIQDCSSEQGSNSCPMHCKHRIQTTGPPGKYPAPSYCYKIIPSGREDTWGTREQCLPRILVGLPNLWPKAEDP